MLLQHIINGLSVGCMYALLALGYSLVFGVLRFINFAHGEVFMTATYIGCTFAAFLGYSAESSKGVPEHPGLLLLVTAVSIVCSAIIGMVIERVIYRPVRKASRMTSLLSAIGVSILLQQVALLIFDPTPRSFPRLIVEHAWTFATPLGQVRITNIRVFIVVLTVTLTTWLSIWVSRSPTGKAMRALSANMSSVSLVGIDANLVIRRTFMVGSALAGAGAVFYGLDQAKVDPWIGVMTGLKAFVASVLGGIGSIPGAMVGGLVLGVIEQLTASLISTHYRDAIAFAVLIVVLAVRPEGLLGKKTIDKV